jgi:hypothetical protein
MARYIPTSLAKGKRRVLQLEQIRKDTYTLNDILQQDQEIYEWYQLNCLMW